MAAKNDGKRKREEVDLTLSDDDANEPVKARKSSHPSTSSRPQALPTPPTSSYQSVYSAPSSSFQQTNDRVTRDSWLGDDADANEIIASSQDDAEGNDLMSFHYGDLPTKIVGVQYYKGLANPGEQILMRREPGNPYDRNAIRIDNVGHTQIGHIPRTMAAKIAKYIDNRWLSMEGQLAGVKGYYDCPLTVHMYGPDPASEAGQMLQQQMKADKLPTKALQDAERRRKAEEKERLAAARAAALAAKKKTKFTNQATGDGSQQQFDMESLLESSQRINPREVGEAADKLGYSEDELKAMPVADKPGGIKTTMLPYQLQALRWLLEQESPSLPGPGTADSVQLWTKAKGCYTNLATNHSQSDAPKLASGGILADDMGLGKTLEMISLIVADAEKFGRGTTLIVAPVSVLSNWADQIAHHVEQNSMLSVYTYHASGRVKMKAEDFEAYDVVLTTYQTLASDYMPGGKGSKEPERKLRSTGPYSVQWRRVILDEGHVIRNSRTKVALACCALMARSRWSLTGTPIVNTIKDLYSMLRFIGITGGMQQLQIFNTVLGRPLARNDPDAQRLLQLIMRAFTLRRRKDMAYIDLKLPKLHEYVHRVEFSKKERERYEALHAEGQGLMHRFDTAKNGVPTYNHFLEILLRMRQCCNHWQLCGERVTKLMEQLEQSKVVALTPENEKALQDILQVNIDAQEECSVCLETLHNPCITACGHSFGRECISRVIELQHKCPFCRAELKDETVLVEPRKEDEVDKAKDDLDLTQSSSKMDALMQILDAIKGDGNKQDKTIVFSQWTRFLDLIEPRLDEAGFKYCRIDGSMPVKQRDAALQSLEEDPRTTIMLASLSVCAVGLNLTSANNVILADTWWAPAIEDQAVDRVHRLGQKKETRVFRLVVEDSVELTTLGIQQEKRTLMKMAFSEKKSKRDDVRAGRMADIRKLLA